MVWGWGEVWDNYGASICFGLGLGSMMSIPVMITGLVVSERRALLALVLGALAAGIICWWVLWTISWSVVYMR